MALGFGYDPLGQNSAFPGMGPNGFSMGTPSPVSVASPPAPASVPTSAAMGSIGSGSSFMGPPMAPGMTVGSYAAQAPVAPQSGQPNFLGSMIWNHDAEGARTGLNTDGLGMLAGGLKTLGSLWQTWQAGKAAREALEFQKESYNTNLENSEKSYNTNLEASTRTRFLTEGKSRQEADQYVRRHSL